MWSQLVPIFDHIKYQAVFYLGFKSPVIRLGFCVLTWNININKELLLKRKEKQKFIGIGKHTRIKIRKWKYIMSDSVPHTITGSELALVLKQKDYPVKYPKWAKCEMSDAQPQGTRTQPLSLQALAGIHIVAHSDGFALQR